MAEDLVPVCQYCADDAGKKYKAFVSMERLAVLKFNDCRTQLAVKTDLSLQGHYIVAFDGSRYHLVVCLDGKYGISSYRIGEVLEGIKLSLEPLGEYHLQRIIAQAVMDEL